MEYADSGAEWLPPPLLDIFRPDFFIPFSCYFISFQLFGALIKRHAWQSYDGFKQYRLCNLTVCMCHAAISGGASLLFMLNRSNIMFNHTLHWYEYWAAQIPTFSMAYFAYDTTDLLRHESSRWTRELLMHHAATITAFGSAVLSRKFVPFALWALLMEVNSVFLHLRTLMQISEHSIRLPKAFSVIRIINILTFIVFRFLVQLWQISWAWQQRNRMHIFYVFIANAGGVFFFVINSVLFYRVLAADGFLGEYGKRHAAINRDDQTLSKMTKNERNT